MLFQAFAINCLLFLYDSQTSRFAIIRLTNDIRLLMCCFHLLSDDGKIQTALDSSIVWQPLHCFSAGGDEGTRTPDLLLAKEALSRLSYIPKVSVVKSGPFRTRT